MVVTNLTGGAVFKQEYAHISGAFSHQIDMSAMPRGLYFAEIRADGERVVKKLVVQ